MRSNSAVIKGLVEGSVVKAYVLIRAKATLRRFCEAPSRQPSSRRLQIFVLSVSLSSVRHGTGVVIWTEAIFWLKARARWKETCVHEVAGKVDTRAGNSTRRRRQSSRHCNRPQRSRRPYRPRRAMPGVQCAQPACPRYGRQAAFIVGNMYQAPRPCVASIPSIGQSFEQSMPLPMAHAAAYLFRPLAAGGKLISIRIADVACIEIYVVGPQSQLAVVGAA